MRPLSVLRPANIIQNSDYVNTVALTTSPQAFDIPSGAAFIAFAATVNFAAKFGSTGVTWPTTNVIDGTASEINPTVRSINSTATTTGYSVVAAGAGLMSVSFYGPGG